MIRLAAAIDDKRGLATDSGIPWNLPTEKTHERQETAGGNMLMGYGTYLEFDKAPPGRQWFVLTDGLEPLRAGFTPVTDLDAFITNPPDNLWLFGGANMFAQTLHYADRLYLTRVAGDFDCTKFFPEFEHGFTLSSREPDQTENDITFHYEIWDRKPDQQLPKQG